MKRNPFLLLFAGSLSLAVSASASFTLVDDFEGHSLGSALDADADWSTQGGDGGPATGGSIIVDGGSQAAWILGGSNNGSYYTGLGAQTIADGTTGTVFFRFRSESSTIVPPGEWLQIAAYATDWQPDSSGWWNHDEAGFYSRWTIGDGTALKPQFDSGATTDVTGSTWYNAWIVADNTANTFDLHLSQGIDDAIGDPTSVTAGSNIPFRTAAGDLDFLFFADTDGNATTGIVLDDIYVDTAGANLLNPIPEPGTAVLGIGALLAALARRKRISDR